ncbi:unnamed protein product [Periconia digitata]|uniref:Uncharacterized protein n=1 Tax=Periconia digitata TaxID=1303443 RepID=A0A9W4USL8_9PLEO|nr:unnamed protein product [Periconia digitata]
MNDIIPCLVHSLHRCTQNKTVRVENQNTMPHPCMINFTLKTNRALLITKSPTRRAVAAKLIHHSTHATSYVLSLFLDACCCCCCCCCCCYRMIGGYFEKPHDTQFGKENLTSFCKPIIPSPACSSLPVIPCPSSPWLL